MAKPKETRPGAGRRTTPSANPERHPGGPTPPSDSNVASPESGGSLSKPLAAYRLGRESYALRGWLELWWNEPDLPDVEDGPAVSVAQMREALAALADEGGAGVLGDLWRKLGQIGGLTAHLLDQQSQSEDEAAGAFGRGPLPGASLWRELRSLADRFLAVGHELRPWYDLGAALGAYGRALDQLADTCRMPDLAPLVGAARALPPRCLPHLEALQAVVRVYAASPQGSPREVLQEALVPLRERLAWLVTVPPSGGLLATRRLLYALDDENEAALRRLPPAEESGPPRPQSRKGPRPRWRGAPKYELWVGGRLIWKVRPIATNVIPVLDGFQRARWQCTIPAPLTEEERAGRPPHRPSSARLHETIKQLNAGQKIKTIRFFADGTGAAISWELIPDPPPP